MANDEGSISQREIDLYRRLSRSGVGLIVMGHAYIRRDGKCSIRMIGIDTDEKISGFASCAKAVHESGEAKLVAQINHGGANVPEYLRSSVLLDHYGTLLAPSLRNDVPEAKAMTEEQAEELVQAYVDAAERAQEAGLDGVQVHCAHGYLMNQMLSPATNRRTDAYGGDIEGRSLFLKRVISGIREATGPDFPILIKIASHDRLPFGLTVEDSIRAARAVEALGVCAVEVSGGMPGQMNTRKPIKEEHEGFFQKQAVRFRQSLKVPIISVSGYRTLTKMQDVLDRGYADLISLSRPFIREPDLVASFREGKSSKAECISCNLCLKRREAPVQCWDKKNAIDHVSSLPHGKE
jgi:2,4-dienoyl-CoA reductase-like NADH-dependent reductase (Old Yellow Enzyme family)